MRAKLHEGMYKTLQQFEVEVYKHWSCNVSSTHSVIYYALMFVI